MSEPIEDSLKLFKVLAERARLRICRMLAEAGEMNVGQIVERLSQPQPAVSHHLALLRLSGVVGFRREGKNNIYALAPETRGPLAAMLLFPFGLESAACTKPETDPPGGGPSRGRHRR